MIGETESKNIQTKHNQIIPIFQLTTNIVQAIWQFSSLSKIFHKPKNEIRTVQKKKFHFFPCAIRKNSIFAADFSAQWCNGSTPDSGSVSLGSNPGWATFKPP